MTAVVQITTLLPAQTPVWRGFYSGHHGEVCPFPSGEGGAERRVRVLPQVGPHPALLLSLRPTGLALRAATFDLREKDTASGFLANLDKSAS